MFKRSLIFPIKRHKEAFNEFSIADTTRAADVAFARAKFREIAK
jgi:hypothetical protein